MNVFDDMVGHYYAYYLECIGYPFHFCNTSNNFKNIEEELADNIDDTHDTKDECELQDDIECNAIKMNTIRCLLNYFPDEEIYIKSSVDGNYMCKFNRVIYNKSFMDNYFDKREEIFCGDSKTASAGTREYDYENTDYQICNFLVICTLSDTYNHNQDINILHALVELFRDKTNKKIINLQGDYLEEFLNEYNNNKINKISNENTIGKIINEAIVMFEKIVQ